MPLVTKGLGIPNEVRDKLFSILLSGVFLAGCESGGNKVYTEPDGKAIFTSNCRLCHGADGQLGLNSASNLKNSQLSKEEMIQVIKHGRNTMQSFKSILSEEEINAVAEYLLTLRN